MNARTAEVVGQEVATVVIEQPPKNAAALVAGGRPKAIVPSDMDQVWRFATIVHKSGLAPKDLNKPETITVAIMHGLEVGLTPLMALQRIAVINGRPSIWGDGAMGLVRASGLCEFVDEKLVGDGDTLAATCRVKRKGEKEAIERSFSVGDARRANLWGKAGPWQQYPKRMLQMRARAFALRDLFADVLGGLYIAEELEGLEEPPLKEVNPKPATRGTRGGELPPVVPQQTAGEPPATEVQTNGAQQAPAASTGQRRPLPPVVQNGGHDVSEAEVISPNAAPTMAPQGDEDGIPTFLKREPDKKPAKSKGPPPANQPEEFRAFIVEKLKTTKTLERLQEIVDTFIEPNVDIILAPDLEDLRSLIKSCAEGVEARS